MIVGVNAGRALVCLVMIDDLDGLLLFPEAFAVLAMGKAYAVSRSAVVPTVVRSDGELVEANSKLQLLSGLAVPLVALPAGIAFAIAGSEGVLVLAVVAYAAATLAALRIPRTQVAAAPATAAESAELRGIGILLAASAMGLVRGIVGFLTFLLLFQLRDGDTWKLGAVLLLTGAGALLGSAVAPALRRSFPEERMLTTLLAVAVVGGLAAAWIGGLAASMLLAGIVAVVSTAGRLAFDSLVQRDAPDANRGRSFARLRAPVPDRVGGGGVDPGADLDPPARRVPGDRRRWRASPCSPTWPDSAPPTATHDGPRGPGAGGARRGSDARRPHRRSNPSRSSIRRRLE